MKLERNKKQQNRFCVRSVTKLFFFDVKCKHVAGLISSFSLAPNVALLRVFLRHRRLFVPCGLFSRGGTSLGLQVRLKSPGLNFP